MENKPVSGFAALMKMRKSKEKEESSSMNAKAVIKDASLTAIEERIRALEQQLNDPDDNDFVDIDYEDDADSSIKEKLEKIELSGTQESTQLDSNKSSKKRESALLEKMKQAFRESQGITDLDENEGYCDACNIKLRGEIDISTHIESASHITRLKIIFKNDVYTSSHCPNTCTACCIHFDSPETLKYHTNYRGHANNVRLRTRLCCCKICNKQFTSGPQLAEHLRGKAHRERVSRLEGKQSQYKRLNTSQSEGEKRRK